ncbi:MAG: dihydrolipoyl dehydrogenase [Candidatus Omnitrophica bacterium]|nr:dihydrolipoyl dehydrogenase [Candidatus Omnitrophota bacterium]
MNTHTQLAIIGAGPGGYVAAFHAADLGLNVTLIDKNANPGGVCLYQGCIPSKALLHAAKVMTDIKEARQFGIDCGEPKVDLDKLRAWKDGVVTRLTSGLGQLTKQRKITYAQGEAKFLNATTVEVRLSDGTANTLTFDKAIIATGSRAVELPFLAKSARVLDSTTALEIAAIPADLLVIGGGYIGLELGSAYAALGARVSVVEALPQLLSNADKDLADVLLRRLKKTFTKIMPDTRVLDAKETPDGVRVTLRNGAGQEFTELYSHVLVSVGRKPNVEGLGLETTKVQLTDSGFIEVDEARRTDEKNIFAIGDMTGNPMLAHKASAEAKVVAEVVAGKDTAYEPRCIPAVIFTDPELAWCGITEQEAHAKGLGVNVSKFPWAASGRALTMGRAEGITKIITDQKTDRILGVGIVGAHAGELIAEGALAVETGMKAEDLALTIHPHPTLSETVMEAAEGIYGNPTHILKPKK